MTTNELLLRGAQVVGVDPRIGDLPLGDVHIKDGKIAAVAPGIEARDAQIIDAQHCIAMPGFVDVHWHMWNSIWRGMAHDAVQYFGLHGLGASYTAEDHYAAVRYAASKRSTPG